MDLSDTRIRAAKPSAKPYKLSDGGGLHLEVRPNGSKLWRLRYRLHGKENVFAIGEYPETSLAAARDEREVAKRLIKQGINPAHHRKLERLQAANASKDTFESLAREWTGRRAVESRWSESYKDSVRRVLEGDLFPSLGPLPIRDIKPAHLLAALRQIEARGALTVAARARFLASEIWRYAVASLRADSDIAAALRGAIRMPDHEHHPYLRREEIPAFLAALKHYPGRRETAIALRLLLLLFPRPSELLQAPWREFDLAAAMWRIPAERMKTSIEHVIPLPTQVVELLRGLKVLNGDYPHLFPHRDHRHRPMTDNALRQALRLMGYSRKLSPHGFRATASTALNEMGFRGDWIERQLAHVPQNRSRAAYNHAPFLEDRRRMLQTWADLIDQLSEPDRKVVIGRFAHAR